ncbi:twin-arginine translocase TatA/TatE family subunit [Microbacterium sp. Gd 4-13]|uniref:Sec-independent protein translocase subunit TatA n=1 Tax=Microbacterium sp. Gd 4-13 TaxID=2173179 RepID=UPI000D576436|nr:Sec-independent protein translocase subunit TatA [Microbacterium sp. Gd 4-13]PVW06729.1 twin-arginine translocase TatA/TatE family subunit [Microbacterium sp. Gd 4-13]
MFQGLTGWHLLIVLAVILLLFGAAKLPALAKSMGQSARVFRSEIKEMKKEDAADPTTTSPVAPEVRDASNIAADPARGTTDPKP